MPVRTGGLRCTQQAIFPCSASSIPFAQAFVCRSCAASAPAATGTTRSSHWASTRYVRGFALTTFRLRRRRCAALRACTGTELSSYLSAEAPRAHLPHCRAQECWTDNRPDASGVVPCLEGLGSVTTSPEKCAQQIYEQAPFEFAPGTTFSYNSFHLQVAGAMAAKAAGVQAIDTIYADFRDAKGLEAEAMEAAADGFDAKAAIHPGQLDAINKAFQPSEDALEWAQQVIDIMSSGSTGVASLNGQMLDQPHLKQAKRLLERAAYKNE